MIKRIVSIGFWLGLLACIAYGQGALYPANYFLAGPPSGTSDSFAYPRAMVIGDLPAETCPSHQWLNSLNVCSQPAYADVSGLASMAEQAANAVAITGGAITGMPPPTNPADVATKSYVDTAASSGIFVHAPVAWATAAVLPDSPTYNNGSFGVGATLTAGTNDTLVVDGGDPALGDRILVKNQAASADNGAYTVTTLGSRSVEWVLTRATDFNTAAAGNLASGAYFYVSGTGGSANPNSAWTLSQTAAITIGSDRASIQSIQRRQWSLFCIQQRRIADDIADNRRRRRGDSIRRHANNWSGAQTGQIYASGYVNKFRNGTFDVWQRGTSALPTSTSGVYTADGWIVKQTGAAATCAQIPGNGGALYGLSCAGVTSNTDTLFSQRIESYDAAAIAGQTVTIQVQYTQASGSNVTPKISTCYASARDNFATCTADLASTSLPTNCATGIWCTEAYTLSVSANAINGYQVTIDCNTALTGAQACAISSADVRVSPGVSTGSNTNPPPPELRSVQTELAQCQRFYEVLLMPASGYTLVTAYYGANVWFATWQFHTTKRAKPAFALGPSASWENATPSNNPTIDGVNFQFGGSVAVYIVGASGIVAATASAELQ